MAEPTAEAVVRVGLQRKPRRASDWVSTGVMLYLRVAIFTVAAVLALQAAVLAIRWLQNLSLLDTSDWTDMLGSSQRGGAWFLSFLAAGVFWTMWHCWRAAHTIDLAPRGVRISGPGTAIEIPRDALLRVDRVRPEAGWLRLIWPRLPARFISAPVTSHGWYRITHRKGVSDVAAADAQAFEHAFARFLGRNLGEGKDRALPARWGGRFWSAVSLFFAGMLALPFAALVVLPIELATLDPKEFHYRNPLSSRIVLALHGDDLGAAGLSRALRRARDPKVVQYVLQTGTRDGFFEISPTELWFGSCGRSLDFVTGRSAKARETRFRYARADFAQFEAELLRCSGTPGYTPEFLLAALDRDRSDLSKLSAFQAVAIGSPEFLRYALDKGLAADERNWMGQTPIMAALAVRAWLLDRRNWSTSGSAYQFDAHLRMAEMLAAAGADLRAQDKAGRSVAYYAAEADAPELALKALGAMERDAAASKTTLGATLVHAAAASGNVPLLRQVIALGLPLDGRTLDGRTALHFAGSREVVLELLGRGLKVNDADARERTPLHSAAMRGRSAAAMALVAAGANQTARDYAGKAPEAYNEGYLGDDFGPIARRRAAAPKKAGKK